MINGFEDFQKLGKEKDWPNQKDRGRMEETKSPADKMMFKVAPLREVEHTAPYFHDHTSYSLRHLLDPQSQVSSPIYGSPAYTD